jgi:ribonuclease HII
MALKPSPEFLLTDFRLELPENELPQTSLLKGDVYCLSIAAASVLAKTTRDQVMRDLDRDYPGYGWRQNKGYGTQAHRSALKRMGHSPAHRKSFSLKK